MRRKFLSIFLIGFASIVVEDRVLAETIDLTQLLKTQGADEFAKSLCYGNHCSGWLNSAYFEYDNTNPAWGGRFTGILRMHNVHEYCIRRPWPLRGKECFHLYNYFANITIVADLVDCKATFAWASTDSEAYKLQVMVANFITYFSHVLESDVIPGC